MIIDARDRFEARRTAHCARVAAKMMEKDDANTKALKHIFLQGFLDARKGKKNEDAERQ